MSNVESTPATGTDLAGLLDAAAPAQHTEPSSVSPDSVPVPVGPSLTACACPCHSREAEFRVTHQATVGFVAASYPLIGIAIRRAREASGLTEQALADTLGRDPDFVRAIENGAVRSLSQVKLIVVALNLSPADFFASVPHDELRRLKDDEASATACAAHVGAAVRTLRRAKGWTQADLASRTAVQEEWVRLVERGSACSASLLGSILRALDVPRSRVVADEIHATRQYKALQQRAKEIASLRSSIYLSALAGVAEILSSRGHVTREDLHSLAIKEGYAV